MNKEGNTTDFFVFLTIEGTIYEEIEIESIDQNITLRSLLDQIIIRLGLPYYDSGGNPIHYLLGRINDDEGVEVLEFEDENGSELALIDYNILSGSHLSILSVPCSGSSYEQANVGPTFSADVDNELSHTPIIDSDECIIIDDNSDGCVDVVHNVDLWPNDSDSFTQTMGCMQKFESLNNNSDDFATTFSPEKNHVKSHKKSNTNKSGIGTVIGFPLNIFGLLKAFAAHSVACAPNLDDNIEEFDGISACLYAPSEVQLNNPFIIRIYMYLPNEQEAIDSKIREIDPKAVKKEYKPLDLPVKKGDKLTVQLDMSDGVECKNTIKNVTWRGHYTDCSFMAKLIDTSQDSIEGTAYVFVNDVPAGEMLFTIDAVEAKPRELYTRVESHRFSKIFISYAHQDESQVRGIAEGCRMLGKDYFFDRHSLQAGDIFKDKIFDYINNADLFVLCWSKNAAESEWVQIEREHALRLIREGKSSLSIYPLSLRPEAPLPLDMSDKYNFGKL